LQGDQKYHSKLIAMIVVVMACKGDYGKGVQSRLIKNSPF